MVLAQLGTYFNRTPSMEIVRARILQQLQTQNSMRSLPGGSAVAAAPLEKAAAELRPKIAEDPETALLYAIVQTEAHSAIKPAELMALRASKKPVHKAAFEIYSSTNLDPARAQALAKTLPAKKFEYRLVAAHALEKGKVPGAREALGKSESAFVTTVVVALLVLAAFSLGIVLIVAYFVLRSRGMAVPRGLALSDLTPSDADRVAMRAAQMLVAFLGVAFVAGRYIPRAALPEQISQVLTYLAIAATVFLLSKVPVDGKWISLRSLGIGRENLGQHILWGLGGVLANLPILAVVMGLSLPLTRFLPAPEHPATVELMEAASPLVVIQLILTACVFAPFIEETMFRGTLFPALTKLLRKPVWAALLSSLIFAAIHPTGIPVWPALATIGAMSCFLSYQTKSLVPSLVMHGVHNFATLLITLTILK
jgi:membrane protease YdiL (CAAX protease family)